MTEPSLPGPPLGGWAPDVTGAAGPEWDAATPAQRDAALLVATHTVWALSGRQFGTAEVLLAPRVPYVAPALYGYRGAGYGYSLTGSPLDPPRPGLLARMDRARALLLPGPVVEVREVTIDGQVLGGEGWAADPDGRLIRLGGGLWPCQDVWAPTFTVRYVRGAAVPQAAQYAAGVYAVEWLKAHTGAGKCTLPKRTREVARQGVTVSIAEPESLARAGLTGVEEVDAFLATVNPVTYAHAAGGGARMTTPPVVWSPELAGHRILAVGPA